jgi:hypothetical protein
MTENPAQIGAAIALTIMTVVFVVYYYKMKALSARDDIEHEAVVKRLRALRRYAPESKVNVEITSDEKHIHLTFSHPIDKMHLTGEQAVHLVSEIVKRFAA